MEKQTTKKPKKLIPDDMPRDIGFTPAPDTSFIQPLIIEAGVNHPLAAMVLEDTAPEMQAAGICNINPAAARSWVHYKVTFKGNTITKLEISEGLSHMEATMGAKADCQEILEKGME